MNAALVNAVHCPIAFAWAAPRKFDMMMASELGTRSAPPMPWSPRAMMRISAVGEIAQIRDATPKMTRPARSTTIRP